jgi:hypothetical protein
MKARLPGDWVRFAVLPKSRSRLRLLQTTARDWHSLGETLGSFCQKAESRSQWTRRQDLLPAGRGQFAPKACPTLIGAIVKAQVFVTDLADSMPTKEWPD